GNLYCQWELSPSSGNALCILFPIDSPIGTGDNPTGIVQTLGSRISILLAVGTPSIGSGNLYCQWELSPSSGNALCILFPTDSPIGTGDNPTGIGDSFAGTGYHITGIAGTHWRSYTVRVTRGGWWQCID
nr:hypothetical protein [Tanacetum cinerariifolium]